MPDDRVPAGQSPVQMSLATVIAILQLGGHRFDCRVFRHGCKRRGIKKPRYGAIGQHGSIAVVERFIRTLTEGLRRLALIPMNAARFRQELSIFVDWCGEHRPHETLGGRTPNEVYHR